MKALTIVTSISEVLVLASLAFGQTTPTVPSVGRDSTAVQELTGIVSDGVCKGQHNRKAVTQFGCTLKCVGDGADYVLVVGERVYILEGTKPISTSLLEVGPRSRDVSMTTQWLWIRLRQ